MALPAAWLHQQQHKLGPTQHKTTHSPLSNPPPILFAAATLDDAAVALLSVPDNDNSDDTGDGILILEPVLGMVPKVDWKGRGELMQGCHKHGK